MVLNRDECNKGTCRSVEDSEGGGALKGGGNVEGFKNIYIYICVYILFFKGTVKIY